MLGFYFGSLYRRKKRDITCRVNVDQLLESPSECFSGQQWVTISWAVPQGCASTHGVNYPSPSPGLFTQQLWPKLNMSPGFAFHYVTAWGRSVLKVLWTFAKRVICSACLAPKTFQLKRLRQNNEPKALGLFVLSLESRWVKGCSDW